MANHVIPMLSSSPPPIDDDQSFVGWDADDDFGTFESALPGVAGSELDTSTEKTNDDNRNGNGKLDNRIVPVTTNKPSIVTDLSDTREDPSSSKNSCDVDNNVVEKESDDPSEETPSHESVVDSEFSDASLMVKSGEFAHFSGGQTSEGDDCHSYMETGDDHHWLNTISREDSAASSLAGEFTRVGSELVLPEITPCDESDDNIESGAVDGIVAFSFAVDDDAKLQVDSADTQQSGVVSPPEDDDWLAFAVSDPDDADLSGLSDTIHPVVSESQVYTEGAQTASEGHTEEFTSAGGREDESLERGQVSPTNTRTEYIADDDHSANHVDANLGNDNDDFGNNKDDLGNNKDDLGNNKDGLGNGKDDLGNDKDDLGNDKDDLGNDKDDLENVDDNAFEQTSSNTGTNIAGQFSETTKPADDCTQDGGSTGDWLAESELENEAVNREMNSVLKDEDMKSLEQDGDESSESNLNEAGCQPANTPVIEGDSDDDWTQFSSPTDDAVEGADGADSVGATTAEAVNENSWSAFPANDESAEGIQSEAGDDNWAAFSQPTEFLSAPDDGADRSQYLDDGYDEFGGFEDAGAANDQTSTFVEDSTAPKPLDVTSVDTIITLCFPHLIAPDTQVPRPAPDTQVPPSSNDSSPSQPFSSVQLSEEVEREITRTMEKPKSEKSKKIICEVVDLNAWNYLKDIETTKALTYVWPDSFANKLLLEALAIDPRNILLQKKTAVPVFASSLGLLEPSRTSDPKPRLPDAVVSASFSDANGVPPCDTHQQPAEAGLSSAGDSSIPPVEFDWNSSGLTNPLDSSNSGNLLDLDFFVQADDKPAVQAKSSALENEFLSSIDAPTKVTEKSLNTLDSILGNAKFTSTVHQNKCESISPEASKILDTIPDLSFMRARVLMFPLRSSTEVLD